MRKWLFNPFIYIAGTRALLIGALAMLITAGVCLFSHTHFNGLLQINTRETPAWRYFAEAGIGWLVPVLLFYIAGSLFSKSKIRFIDVAGTFALSRWVMLFTALAGFSLHTPGPHATIAEITATITPVFILCALVSTAAMVWFIALMYNAFIVSCNMKKSTAPAVFVITLLITEVSLRILLHSI